VASLAEVSLGTVSHYINHPDRVSPEKRERIQKAIDDLGFVRNNAAWQLRIGRSATIAYIAPDVSNPFFATIAEGVERTAAAGGLKLFIANSNSSREREDSYLEMFEAQGVQGMLVASHEPVEDRLTQIRLRGTPSVLMGQKATSPAQPSVSLDEMKGGFLAVRHLIDIGRTRLAYVGGPLSVPQVGERYEGALAAVRESPGVSIEQIDAVERTIAEGREVADQIAARPAGERPDGIFAVNDLMALGLLQTLVVEHGIRVPQDIAIVGYDDTVFGASSIIPLTTVRGPHDSFGPTAVDLLTAEIAGEASEDSKHIVFDPELVIRASTVPTAAPAPVE
jgi:LacI family transcriptional regulator